MEHGIFQPMSVTIKIIETARGPVETAIVGEGPAVMVIDMGGNIPCPMDDRQTINYQRININLLYSRLTNDFPTVDTTSMEGRVSVKPQHYIYPYETSAV